MDCPDCGAATIAFEVPTDQREFVPGGERALAFCTHCLGLHPAPESEVIADSNDSDDPDDSGESAFAAVSEAFPTGEEARAMALAVGLLPTFALYRREIEALLEGVERAGTDPLLVLDRLADDPTLEPTADLRRRREHLEQTLA